MSALATEATPSRRATTVRPRVRRDRRPLAYGLATAAVLTLAMALRTFDLDGIGLNSDEAVYAGQAGSLAGDPDLNRLFSPFRAHPLLTQALIAVAFRVAGVDDGLARSVVAIGFGVVGVAATIWSAARMYDRRTALLAGTLLAVLPYHVLLSRQVMLEVPAATLMTGAAGFAYLYARSGRRTDLVTCATLCGLVLLTKSGTILFGVALAVFLIWSGAVRRIRPLHLLPAAALGLLALAPFPLTRLAFGGESTGGYVLFQFLRPANHPPWYFPVVLWKFTGPAFLLLVLVGLVLMACRRSLADRLMLCWATTFIVFHQLWPTKLFPYLVVITPVMVIAATQAVIWLAGRVGTSRRRRLTVATVCMLALTLPLTVASGEIVLRGTERLSGPLHLDAEVQDFAGAREAADWIATHTPDGSVVLTIGPSTGNIIGFYAHRDSYALSVSPDPARRNPAYRPLPNPDLAIRDMRITYAVWDYYSADRSAFYNARLMRYVRKYRGTPVLYVWLDEARRPVTGTQLPEGEEARLVLYDLVGGDPPSPLRGPVGE